MKEMEPIKREYIERHETAKAMISAMKGVISPYDVVAVAEVLRDQPAADVVEVVRCEFCKHRDSDGWCFENGFWRDKDEFCSRGERSQKNE